MNHQKLKQKLKNLYGFEFPESFFEFYEFTKQLPDNTFSGVDGILGLYLGEIFKKFKPSLDDTNFNPIKENRYYNDPPEFFTIFDGITDGQHWGYYVDNQNYTKNLPVATFYSNDAFEINISGNDIFETFRKIIERSHQNLSDLYNPTEGDIKFYKEHNQELNKIRNILMQFATSDRHEIGYDYIDKYHIYRHKTALTFDNMGIVVPENLYKPLETIDKFQEFDYRPTTEDVGILYEKAVVALQEEFPGSALKLGKDLWIFAEFHEISYILLEMAYEVMGQKVLLNALQQAKEFRRESDDFFKEINKT